MPYTEQHILRTCECDMERRWKPSAILEAMQEIATAHCNSVNLGRDVTDALGVVWILSRCRVEFTRLPRIGEEYTLETFPQLVRHLFFPRAHMFRGGDGAVIGGASSLWMLMDINTRKTVGNPDVASRLPAEEGAPVRMPGTVRPPRDAEPMRGEILPQYTDFDLNGHVNNTKYMDWCWNALGFDGLEGRAFTAFEVNYDREVRRGEVIQTELYRTDGAVTFLGFHGGERCFGIQLSLAPA